MKKFILLAVFLTVLAALLMTSVVASAEPLGYPGYTWGSVMYPSDVASERGNLVFDGKIEQGIDWIKFGQSYTLNTFVDLRYTLDTKGYPWNNRITPGIGAKISRVFSELGIVDFGVKLVHENCWKEKENRNSTGVQAFLEWYFDWNLKKK